MSVPVLTPPEQDVYVRAASLYDLEKTIAKFIRLILDTMRLDNPSLNEVQPDIVPYDYKERAETLERKIPPQVVRGRIPRTVTGEIDPNKLPSFPSVIVQAVTGRVELADSATSTMVTVRILVNAYDENPDGGGYQDVLNMTETLAIALYTYGSGALDERYPIVPPLDWKLIEPDTFPHFLSEMTTTWQLPAGRPMPDLSESIIPGEAIDIRLHPDLRQETYDRFTDLRHE